MNLVSSTFLVLACLVLGFGGPHGVDAFTQRSTSVLDEEDMRLQKKAAGSMRKPRGLKGKSKSIQRSFEVRCADEFSKVESKQNAAFMRQCDRLSEACAKLYLDKVGSKKTEERCERFYTARGGRAWDENLWKAVDHLTTGGTRETMPVNQAQMQGFIDEVNLLSPGRQVETWEECLEIWYGVDSSTRRLQEIDLEGYVDAALASASDAEILKVSESFDRLHRLLSKGSRKVVPFSTSVATYDDNASIVAGGGLRHHRDLEVSTECIISVVGVGFAILFLLLRFLPKSLLPSMIKSVRTFPKSKWDNTINVLSTLGTLMRACTGPPINGCFTLAFKIAALVRVFGSFISTLGLNLILGVVKENMRFFDFIRMIGSIALFVTGLIVSGGASVILQLLSIVVDVLSIILAIVDTLDLCDF